MCKAEQWSSVFGLRRAQWPLLTGQHGGHQRSKHEEKHGEEEKAGVAEHLLGLVADAQVQQPDQDANTDVRRDSQVCQYLGTRRKGCDQERE